MAAADSSFEVQLSAEDAALDGLLKSGQITEQDVEQGRSLRTGNTRSLLVTLNQIGTISDDVLTAAFQRVTGLPLHDGNITTSLPVDPALSLDFMRDTQCLLLSQEGPLLVVDPLDERLMRAAEFALGMRPEVQIIKPGDWLHAFQSQYPNETNLQEIGGLEEDVFATELADQNRDAPIVRQVGAWLGEAADLGASDIHFDARRNALGILYRVDGKLRTISTQPKNITSSVIARIKVIADLDMGERNKPQDGRATIVVRGRRLDIRVSIIPTIDGESAVIRLLDRPDGLLSLTQLGFDAAMQDELRKITNHRHGMFVVAGPTGSGKTTTLYACIEELKGRGLKILSVEDPVEYHFDHVNQVQVSEKAGRDFAGALRAFLRHDPDVILVGEIRDSETAQVAVQASLTGHLVLATIHAIDTARVKTRLIDMGVEPFKLDACLLGSMAQRLVRTLCPDCSTNVPLTPAQAQLFRDHDLPVPEQVFAPQGCSSCHNDGYKGRTVIADMSSGADASQSSQLMHKALNLVASGRTGFSEIVGLAGQ